MDRYQQSIVDTPSRLLVPIVAPDPLLIAAVDLDADVGLCPAAAAGGAADRGGLESAK